MMHMDIMDIISISPVELKLDVATTVVSHRQHNLVHVPVLVAASGSLPTWLQERSRAVFTAEAFLGR
jgi:hypothetical protein